MRRHRSSPARPWGYRPPHAWLGVPGDGIPLRHRKPHASWAFRWRQLRILLLAAAVAGIAWSNVPGL